MLSFCTPYQAALPEYLKSSGEERAKAESTVVQKVEVNVVVDFIQHYRYVIVLVIVHSGLRQTGERYCQGLCAFCNSSDVMLGGCS